MPSSLKSSIQLAPNHVTLQQRNSFCTHMWHTCDRSPNRFRLAPFFCGDFGRSQKMTALRYAGTFLCTWDIAKRGGPNARHSFPLLSQGRLNKNTAYPWIMQLGVTALGYRDSCRGQSLKFSLTKHLRKQKEVPINLREDAIFISLIRTVRLSLGTVTDPRLHGVTLQKGS